MREEDAIDWAEGFAQADFDAADASELTGMTRLWQLAQQVKQRTQPSAWHPMVEHMFVLML
jgi:hypothetical protein